MSAGPVDATRRAPRRPPSWLWPVLLVVVVLVTSVAAVAVQLNRVRPVGLLPADGSSTPVLVAGVGTVRLEQSLLDATALAGLGRLGALSGDGIDPAARWLRLSLLPAPGGPTVLLFQVAEDRLTLRGIEMPDAAVVLRPGLLVAAALVDAHQRGTAVTGLAHGPYDARVAGRHREACIDTTAVLTLPAPLGASRIALTACQGRGVTSFSLTSTIAVLEVRASSAATAGAYQGSLTGSAPADPGDPGGWSLRHFGLHQRGGFGPQIVTLGGLSTPVARPRHRLAGIDPSSGDIVAIGPRTGADETVELEWRAHPGGTPIGLASLGGLLVVATGSAVTAYDDDGRQVWTRPLVATPVGLGAGLADTADGSVWCALSDGRLLTLNARTGEQRAVRTLDKSLAPPAVAAAGRLVAHQAADLVAFDLTSGGRLWSVPLGMVPSVVAADDTTAVAASLAATALLSAADGLLGSRAAGADVVAIAGRTVVTAAGVQVNALRGGRSTRSWTLDRPADGAVLLDSGVVLTEGSGVTWLN